MIKLPVLDKDLKNVKNKRMKPYIHKVNYYETDKMGVTHHSNYFRFMEEARIDYMDQMGMGYDKMEEVGIISPVVTIEGHYKKTTTFPDTIIIEVQTEKCLNFKVVLNYTMKVNDEIVFLGKSTSCFLNKEGKPINLEKTFPEFHKKILENLAEKK